MSKKLERKFSKPTQISKHLTCSICTDVFVDATRIFCGHTFCKKCIEKWHKASDSCPECRTTIDGNLMGKDLLAEKIIQDLEVLCINKLCDWKGKLAELPKHVRGCAYAKPPEWLSQFQSTQSFEENPRTTDLALVDNEEYQERIVEEVARKSLLERLYTKNEECKDLMDSVFSGEKKKPVRGKKKKEMEKKNSMEFYDSFFQSLQSDDEETNQEKIGDESSNTFIKECEVKAATSFERINDAKNPFLEGKSSLESNTTASAKKSEVLEDSAPEDTNKRQTRGRRKAKDGEGISQTAFKKTKTNN